MRRAVIIALWIIGIVSGGVAIFGLMDHYGFILLIRVIAALAYAGLVGFCAFLFLYPTVRRAAAITALWMVGIALVVAIIAAILSHYGIGSVAKVFFWGFVWIVGSIAVGFVLEHFYKASVGVIAFLKANPTNAAGIIAAAAALVFAIAIVIIVVAVIIKIF